MHLEENITYPWKSSEAMRGLGVRGGLEWYLHNSSAGGASSSATANSLFGSRPTPVSNPLKGSTGSSHFFRDLAQSREKDAKAAFEGSSGTPFNPSQKDADLNPLAAGSKKRKNKGAANSAADRNVKPKPAVKQSSYVLVCVPQTKAVARGICKVPTAQMFVDQSGRGGFVQDMSLPSDASPQVVKWEMESRYDHIPAVEEFGLRVLRTKTSFRRTKRGRKIAKSGTGKLLSPLKLALSVAAIQTALTDSNVRGAGPRFRKLVFVALNPQGPNLPFGDASTDSDDLDHDLSSVAMSVDSDGDSVNSRTMSDHDHATTGNKSTDQSDAAKFTSNESASDAFNKRPTAKSKGKQKENVKGNRFDAGDFDEDMLPSDVLDEELFSSGAPGPPPEPEPKIPQLVVPDAHKKLERLLKNITGPNLFNRKPTAWWAAAPRGSFIAGIRASELCSSAVYSALAPEHLPSFIQANICRPFAPLRSLSDHLMGKADALGTSEFEAKFDQGFAVGPHGVHGLVDHIRPAYLALAVVRGTNSPQAAVNTVYDELVSVSYGLLRCVEHFRFKYSRSQWDPTGGYREFAIIREKSDADLPRAGNPTDAELLALKLLAEAIHKPRPNISQISFLLMDVFGDSSNPKEMSQDKVVCGGEFGIGHIYDLVAVPILDQLDTDDSEYASIFGLTCTFFNGVARRLRAYLKARSADDDNSKQDADAGPGPGTRSRANRKTGKHGDGECDPMTSEEDLGPDWANDCGPRRKGGAAKGKKKAPRSPSPIIISSEDSDSDSEWQQTYAKYAKKTKPRRASARQSASTSTAAPNPGQNQMRARPVWLDPDARPEDDLEDAGNLARRTRYWQDLLRDIIERFPHPDPNRQLTANLLFAPGVTRLRQYHLMSLAYHVDRNIAGTPHFRAVAAVISQVLNDTRVSKADRPAWSL
ncbi:hypothetical protein C8R46DRAFT_1035501 [Mycena filopes]|nr:hypothetical protein C8R46DRAFT_1035501 [Mycena filopes]